MRLFRGSSGPRGRFPAGLALLALVVCVQHRGVLGGRVLFFEDIAAYFEPLWTAAARSMRHGRLPTWELGAWSGQPLLGDPQVGVLYPLHWLWLVVAPLRVYAVSVPLHAFIAGSGMYLSSRESGRSRPAATASSIALALSAFYVLEARHIMFLASAAWLPWLAWSIERTVRSGSPRRIALVAAFGALALLGGGWSMLIFAAPPLAVFSVARLFRTSAPVRRAADLATGVALSLGLAAAQLLPAFAHAAVSPRALPLAETFASSFSWPSLRFVVSLALPLWYGDDAQGTYVGGGDQWELCGYGMGLVAALLAVLGVARAPRRRRVERLAYLSLVSLAAIAALGDHGPLWVLWRTLPLLRQVRCPARALFVFTVVAPMLCAAGVDALRVWLRSRFGGRSVRFAWFLPIAIAGELLVGFRAENPTVPITGANILPEVIRDAPRTDGRTLLDVHLGQAFHNGGLRWGFQATSGYSSLPLWRYLHLCYIANHRAVYPGWPTPSLAHDLTAQGLWTLDSSIVDLLNVQRLITDRAHPPRGTGWLLEVAGDDGIDRWRNTEALPRAFVVHAALRVPDEAEAARRMADGIDPRTVVVVEEDVGLPTASAIALEPAQVLDGKGTDVHIVADSDGHGVLLLSMPWEPSWTVTVDDRPASLLRVDYALMGVVLPDGNHRVTFARVDQPLRLGLALSLFSLALLLALAVRRSASRPTARS